MKRTVIAGFAAGAAMMIGGALGAVSPGMISGAPKPLLDSSAGVMNPMVAGQAMLASRSAMENIAASPDHTALAAALAKSGIGDALKGEGQFTVFAPSNLALGDTAGKSQAQLARAMGYLVVPGKYDSQTLLKVIGEGGGEARLKTVQGGVLLAKMNGPTNIILMDEKGRTADIAIYDVYDRNGVMHVVDRMLEPGAVTHQVASN